MLQVSALPAAQPAVPSKRAASPARLAPVVSLDAERQRRLLAEYGPMVDRLVRQAASKVGFRFTADELRSAAWMGLMEAQRRFDAQRGIPFAAFAQHRIAGAILDEIRGEDDLARPIRHRARTIEGIRVRLTRRLQREPTDSEIARVAGEDLDTYHRRNARQQAQAILSIEALPPEETLGIVDGANSSPLDQLCESASNKELATALDGLPERQRTILSLYYREERSYREIGQILGVTESRICQIIKATLARLRETMECCA